MTEQKKPIECTVRVFKLLPIKEQRLGIATEGMIEYKDLDTNYDYVPMIEKSAYDKAVEAMTEAMHNWEHENADYALAGIADYLKSIGELP